MEPVTVRETRFESRDGTVLEGDMLSPANPTGTAVVCHPHPLYGGSRRDPVVAALCRGLVGSGRKVFRFDFRGSGGSSGSHDGGAGERDDLIGAIDAIDPGDTGLIIAGYSFGADIALSVAHPAATRWLVVAAPLATLPMDSLVAATDDRPVDMLQPANDQFNPADQLISTVSEWTAARVHVLESTDHFLGGSHQLVTTLVSELLS